MILGAKDIRCNKEINWFRPRMNQFVLQTNRNFQTTHTADSQSHTRFTTALYAYQVHTVSKAILHWELNNTKFQIWMRAKKNKITKYQFETPNTALYWF